MLFSSQFLPPRIPMHIPSWVQTGQVTWRHASNGQWINEQSLRLTEKMMLVWDKQPCQDGGCRVPSMWSLPPVRICSCDPSSPDEHCEWPSTPYIFPCNFTGSGCVMNANNEGVDSLLSERVEECIQLIMQDSANLVMAWLLSVWVVRLWATHWILCFSFLTCKTGEEQLDLRDVARMFTRKLMRLKSFPGYLHRVSTQETFSQVIFFFSTLWFWAVKSNNLITFCFTQS